MKIDKNDLIFFEKVKSVHKTLYKAIDKFGNINKGNSRRDEYLIFNKKGNIIEKNLYNPDGSLRGKYTYKYDGKRNKIETQAYNSDVSFGSKYTYKYNGERNLIEENWYNSDGSLYRKKTFKYDKKGYKIKANRYKPDGSLFYEEAYKYEFNKQGDWVKKTEVINQIPKEVIVRKIKYFE